MSDSTTTVYILDFIGRNPVLTIGLASMAVVIYALHVVMASIKDCRRGGRK